MLFADNEKMVSRIYSLIQENHTFVVRKELSVGKNGEA